MSTHEWGPRGAGPQLSPPPPPRPRTSGCLVGFLLVLVMLGVALIPSAPESGWLLLALGGGTLAWLLSGPIRRSMRLRKHQLRQSAEAEEWLHSRPAARVAASANPLHEARSLTAAQRGGVFLGLTPDYREWTTADRQQAVLVLGPPRAGKTSALIVPAILAASGPVVSTSTKGEVMCATAGARSELGRVWLFDPSGTSSVPAGVLELHWSPVRAARTWDGARAIADAMVDASSAGKGVDNASYWTESAKALLAPLLHAAALEGKTIVDVRRWVSRMWLEEAGEILEAAGAEAAADDLSAAANTEERERSAVNATVRLVLNAYGSDSAAVRSARPNFDADRFVRSTDTVYVTAPSHLQSILAPLVAGLLEEIRDATYAHTRAQGQAQLAATPPVLWALDEVANIAPLRKLPGIVSEGGGQGLQVMACLQDLSQARERWGVAAEGFLTLFGTKVIFPGIGDAKTLSALSTLAGDWDRPYTIFNASTGRQTTAGLPFGFSMGTTVTQGYSHEARREAVLTPAEIANIPPGHALTLRTNHWGLIETTPFFQAAPWPSVLDASPEVVIARGGPDDLPARYGTQVG